MAQATGEQFLHAEAVLENAVAAGEAGASVLAVATSSETLFLKAVSPCEGPQAKESSVFLLASITKPFMSTAVMQLVEPAGPPERPGEPLY